MAIIHMSTEELISVSGRLLQDTTGLVEEISCLTNSFQSLDSAWQGGQSDLFQADAEVLIRRLSSQQVEMEVLIERLCREIAEWEEVDRRGTSRWQDMGWQHTSSWLNSSLPIAAGLAAVSSLPSITHLMTTVSLGELIANLPAWLRSILDRTFPSPDPVISPIPDPVTAPEQAPAVPVTAAPAAPEVALPPEASPSAQPEIVPSVPSQPYYDVPIRSQGNLYGSAACTPTSVSMVLDYFHAQDSGRQTITPEDLIARMDSGDGTPGHGISLSNMTDELNDLGYNNITTRVGADLEELNQQLESGPVIVTTGVRIVGPGSITSDVPRAVTGPGNVIHAMVVKGINEEGVIINDPWSGSEMVVSTETFNQMWTNGSNGLYAIRP